MSSTRMMLRSTRAVRTRPVLQPQQRQLVQRRFQSSSSGSTSSTTHALYGGLAGGGVAFVLGYAWYHFSGAKTMVNAASQAKSYYTASKAKLQESSPGSNEALEWLQQQATFYAAFIPGGRAVVDSAFNDISTIRKSHGDEVDKIVKEAYNDLREVASKDLSPSTATEAFQVLQKHLSRLSDLAGDSASEILKNHPELEKKLGPGISRIRDLGSSVGPEANKLVQDTYGQIKDIVSSHGLSGDTVQKVQKLLKEKTEQLQKLGDKAWDKGVQEAKPYLDKAPKVKELIESNKKDLLGSGDLGQLWEKVKKAGEKGDAGEVESFVKDVKGKAEKKANESGLGGGQIEETARSWLEQVMPGKGSGELVGKLQRFKDVVQEADTQEIKKFVEDTVKEVGGVLERRADEGRKLVEQQGKGK